MLTQLAALLGVPTRAAEDALYSEPLARAVLTRRALLGGSLALLCSNTAYALPAVKELGTLAFIYKGLDVATFSVDTTPMEANHFAVLNTHLNGSRALIERPILFDTVHVRDALGQRMRGTDGTPMPITLPQNANVTLHSCLHRLPNWSPEYWVQFDHPSWEDFVPRGPQSSGQG